MRLIWLPTWRCTNYAANGQGINPACPYCPLGYRGGRLTIAGESGAIESPADLGQVLDFFGRSASVVKDLTLSGGEPLLYRHLRQALEAAGKLWPWGVTSNMMATKPLENLEGLDFSRCVSWNCSFHPFSNQAEKFAENVKLIRSFGVKFLHVTLVVTSASVGKIQSALPWLESLPVDRFNVHYDLYKRDAGQSLWTPPGGTRWLVVSESTREARGTLCRKRGLSMVLAPSGSIHECVTKAYAGMDSLGHCADVDLGSIVNDRAEWCGLRCSLPCDVLKHSV